MLPQVSGFIKYFENNKKYTSILVDNDDDLILKYNKIRKRIIKLLSVEFHSQPVYDQKYIKTRVNTIEEVITKFTEYEIPKENFCIHVLLQVVLIL